MFYEEKVVSKETDKLCSVVFDGEQQMFTGTKDECEKWIKAKKGPNASRFSIKDSAAVNVVEEGCAKTGGCRFCHLFFSIYGDRKTNCGGSLVYGYCGGGVSEFRAILYL